MARGMVGEVNGVPLILEADQGPTQNKQANNMPKQPFVMKLASASIFGHRKVHLAPAEHRHCTGTAPALHRHCTCGTLAEQRRSTRSSI